MAKAKKKLDAKATPRSIGDVTRFLAQSGVEGVSLERGRGFFYFVGVPVHNWLNRTIVTPDLGSRTLGEWLEEYRTMAKQNASADPFATKQTKRRKKATRR
jgi:hypothetical protein